MCLHNICFLVQSSSSLCCWLIKQRCLWSRGQLLAATLLSGNGIMLRVQKIQEWNLQNASYWLLSWSISKGIGYVQRSSKYSLCDKLQGQKQRRVQPSEFFLNIWRFFHFCFSLILSVWEGRPCSVFSLFFVCLFWGSCAVEENVQLKLDGFFDSAFLEVSSLSQWQEDVKPRCVHSSKNLVSCAHCFVSLLWAFFFFFFVFSFVVSVSLSLCCVEIVFSSRMCGMFPPSRGRCATEASFFVVLTEVSSLFQWQEDAKPRDVLILKDLVSSAHFLVARFFGVMQRMCTFSFSDCFQILSYVRLLVLCLCVCVMQRRMCAGKEVLHDNVRGFRLFLSDRKMWNLTCCVIEKPRCICSFLSACAFMWLIVGSKSVFFFFFSFVWHQISDVHLLFLCLCVCVILLVCLCDAAENVRWKRGFWQHVNPGFRLFLSDRKMRAPFFLQ